eukprot:UN12733
MLYMKTFFNGFERFNGRFSDLNCATPTSDQLPSHASFPSGSCATSQFSYTETCRAECDRHFEQLGSGVFICEKDGQIVSEHFSCSYGINILAFFSFDTNFRAKLKCENLKLR